MKIEAGKYYRTRGGLKVGPMECIGAQGYWRDGRGGSWYPAGRARQSGDHPEDLVAEWWTDGPVREVTRKEIVPGKYGILDVGAVGATGARVPVAFEMEGHRFYDASELRAAAAVFTELADALEQ